ncbi:MAG TPA: hypothetical protein VKI01_09630 [Acidimicrobiia bacterium]|nr:hypothetical protein [Acidimicrobiia bacterium]
MSFVRSFVGFANGTLLFLTFALVGVTFNLALDVVMRRIVSPEVRHRAGPTAAVTVQVLATIYAVLVAFVIVNQYSQLRSANEQVAAKAADLSAMYENSRIFPVAEGDRLRGAITAYTVAVVDRGFPKLAESPKPDRIGDKRLEGIFATLRAIHPTSQDESAAYSKTLDQLDGVVATRERLVNASGETVPWPLVFMLAIMGLAVLVVSTLLDTQHRKAHVAILTALALLVSLTLALVVSLNFSFDGILPISDAPLRHFLAFRSER